MTTADETMKRIEDAMALQHAGETDGARQRFTEIWEEIAPDGDPFHRCVLAHYMADLQQDPRDELAWDLRALEAAASVTDERARQHHASLTIRGFYPSLHLNLAADYHRLGDSALARTHLAQARRHLDTLQDDGYGQAVRAAIQRLDTRGPGASVLAAGSEHDLVPGRDRGAAAPALLGGAGR
ncbi:hypothetical protein HNP84_005085 [Thermocatellispora tengchongensis]|uniref:Tetratricopeptide repeat protein n=1 Tax=Thermocatellispora tengchongensis TaxID=1073253 RepID=A0A840P8M7_9ACTN|nr:hypothetical protein [Thermocatellispora tengchongensis]MBB5135349.1 hypothetical protein [Thermocatellispora tengchongensis]